jgi:hypothetical protein
MKLDQATAVLRPRSAWEAVDLGCALARRHWGRLMSGWLTVALPLWAVIIILCRDHPGAACFFIWLTKPVLTRQPVFFLSRALFGSPPANKDFLRDWKASLWKGLFGDLTIRRLSFQRAFRLPVVLLEGQRGKGYAQRVSVLSAHGGGSASSLAFAGLVLQLVITVGLVQYVGSYINESLENRILVRDALSPEIPLWLAWMWTGFFAVSVALIEPFYAAAGFALYINSRTHLEGWDIEVAFRRMSLRLVPPAAAAALVLFAGLGFTGNAHAAARQDPKSIVQEVLKGPDFELEKYKVPKKPEQLKKSSGTSSEDDREFSKDRRSGSSGFGFHWLGYVIIAAVAGTVLFLLWQNRMALRRQRTTGRAAPAGPRVVMGMDLAPESLPDDIPQTAWKEFQAGRAAEALRLLYRGSLAWLVDRAALPVHESDTEGDCLRHARRLPDAERISFFEYLTSVWINCAYAGEAPDPAPMKRLCDNWPFSLRDRRPSGMAGSATAILTLSLSALLLAGCSRPGDDVEYEEKIAGYKGAAAVNPWLAATRMLEQMGFTVQARQSLGTMPATNATVFIPVDSVSSRGAAKQVLSWAGRGGHLIIACTHTDRFHNDWSDFDDVETRVTPPLLEELDISFASRVPDRSNEFMLHRGKPYTLESPDPVGLDLHSRSTDVLAGDEDSASLASFPWNLGRVTLVASADSFRNRYLEKADNASVLYQLVNLGGNDSLTFIFAGKTNLLGMLMEYAWMPLIAVALLIMLWLWRHLPVFGPAQPADQSSVRHFGTQLDEAGTFLSERAGHDALLGSARRHVLQAAAQRGVSVAGENTAENLAARTGIPAADIQDALHNHSESGDLITEAATLQKLQQSLGVTL